MARNNSPLMSQVFVCKQCGAQMPSELDSCPECYPDRGKGETVSVFLILVLLASSFLMVGSSYVNVKSFGPTTPRPVAVDLQVSAYQAAQNFINQRYPGQKTFSEPNQSSIESSGQRVKIVLLANEFDGDQPVRSFYQVEMERVGNDWKLINIQQ